ncbi:hypothetical protein K7432_014146 [Basidiobolus ranarum]|uniref:PI31 proteasome regulator N-terminal domain-containing protein n=1 Tax=Basidiobolus ranarum TaxID=34480 RepID=A0ABR2WI25_9FUNG
MSATQDPLSVQNLLSLLEKTVGRTESTDALLRNGSDALAALFHSIMISLGFKFLGIGDEGKAETEEPKLPTGWNSTDCYSFRYTHSQSQLTFLIKSVHIENKLVVHGSTKENNKIESFEVDVSNYLSPSFKFPLTADSNQHFASIFWSPEKLKEVVDLYRTKIVQVLLPKLNKPGYEETRTSGSDSNPSTGRASQGRPRPEYPDYDEPRSSHGGLPYFHPTGIGRSDLDPLAASPGMVSPRGAPFGIGSGDGMYVGPDHPLFSGISGDDYDQNPIFGGPNPLPR